MCEGVGEDSRNGVWMWTFMYKSAYFYLNVCEIVNMALHVHLGGE